VAHATGVIILGKHAENIAKIVNFTFFSRFFVVSLTVLVYKYIDSRGIWAVFRFELGCFCQGG
jgi:hypothetical protein